MDADDEGLIATTRVTEATALKEAEAGDAGRRPENDSMGTKILSSAQTNAPSKPFSLTMPQTYPNLPPRPEFIIFSVPYLCKSNPYDGKDFWTYPGRVGWLVHVKDEQCHIFCPPGYCTHEMTYDEASEQENLVRPSKFSRSDGAPFSMTEKVTFLQAWLFFGVLKEVSSLCGLDIDIATEFIVDGDSISTEKLNGLPGRWFEAVISTNRAGDKELMGRILTIGRHSVLMLSDEIFDCELVVDESAGVFKNNVNPVYTYNYGYTRAECRVLHSLEILVRTIGLHLLLHIYTPGFTSTEDEGWGRGRVAHSLIRYSTRLPEGMEQLSEYAFEELKEKGWCKSELEFLKDHDFAFASLLSRPRIRDHSSCGEVVCNAYHTDEATYKTRHVEEQCNCDFVEVHSDVLTSALSEDRIPILVITEDLGLRIVPNQDYPYIAISHVWADGLGNAQSNALPRCQLQRLRGYINHLSQMLNPRSPSPAAFWMDTLCIPVYQNAKAYRKKAIQLLGETFRNATAVLILDRELEIVESATAPFIELVLRILCSGWVKRLWTLQEATLASESQGSHKLYFQMRDGPFLYQKNGRERKVVRLALDRTASEIEIDDEERSFLCDEGVLLQLRQQIPSIPAIRDIDRKSGFQNIYDAIEHRSTSKYEDVPVCVASLMDLDLSEIVSVPDAEHRMANFYMLMREVPCGVAWVPTAERLSIHPFRWAPKLITSCSMFDWSSAWEDGICDTAGLHIKASGFVFAESEVQRLGLGSTLPLVFNIVSEDSGELLNQLLWPHIIQRQDTTNQIPFQRNLALIFRPLWRSPGVLAKSKGIPRRNDVIAVAIEDVIRSGDSSGEPHASELICRTVGFLSGERWSVDVPETEIRCHGHTTADDQRWCLT